MFYQLDQFSEMSWKKACIYYVKRSGCDRRVQFSPDLDNRSGIIHVQICMITRSVDNWVNKPQDPNFTVGEIGVCVFFGNQSNGDFHDAILSNYTQTDFIKLQPVPLVRIPSIFILAIIESQLNFAGAISTTQQIS